MSRLLCTFASVRSPPPAPICHNVRRQPTAEKYKIEVKQKTLVIMSRILIAILVTLSIKVYAQEKIILEESHVDKRVELLSIVFRLAERPEYSTKVFTLYTDRIERHFKKYNNHELIQFTKSIINERKIGYDAVAWMSIYLDDNLNLLSNINGDIWQRDPRWTKEIVEKFIPLLQQFAKDTGFDDFFNENASLYDEAVKCFAPMNEPLDLDWYFAFYGKEPSETFSIIIGIGNGMNNYGPSLDYTNGSRKVYSVMGVGQVDSIGMPVFVYNALAPLVIIHEFNHSFVNSLINKNKEALRESGEKMFSVIKDVLANQAYGTWEIMMCEALVRAAVIKYIQDSDYYQQLQQMIGSDFHIKEFMINMEKENGFFWIEELIAELESYDRQRDKYPTLESYMPKLIEAYKIWAEKMPNA